MKDSGLQAVYRTSGWYPYFSILIKFASHHPQGVVKIAVTCHFHLSLLSIILSRSIREESPPPSLCTLGKPWVATKARDTGWIPWSTAASFFPLAAPRNPHKSCQKPGGSCPIDRPSSHPLPCPGGRRWWPCGPGDGSGGSSLVRDRDPRLVPLDSTSIAPAAFAIDLPWGPPVVRAGRAWGIQRVRKVRSGVVARGGSLNLFVASLVSGVAHEPLASSDETRDWLLGIRRTRRHSRDELAWSRILGDLIHDPSDRLRSLAHDVCSVVVSVVSRVPLDSLPLCARRRCGMHRISLHGQQHQRLPRCFCVLSLPCPSSKIRR
ncbi:hypothetical protein G7046_g763 [Stylonectria norvegica]|nr:hypothetical protein G7046_g763 [Stylonectria norvegica]